MGLRRRPQRADPRKSPARQRRQETLRRHENSAQKSQMASRRDFALDDCFPPEHIESYVNKSLANLGVEKLDLIQFHTWEDRWLNDERLPRAVEKLRSSGKAQAVGVSVNRWEPYNGIRA